MYVCIGCVITIMADMVNVEHMGEIHDISNFFPPDSFWYMQSVVLPVQDCLTVTR